MYLKDRNLAPRDSKGNCHTFTVDTEAITLPWGSQVEAPHVGDVCVAVHHCTLDMTKLGGWPWMS